MMKRYQRYLVRLCVLMCSPQLKEIVPDPSVPIVATKFVPNFNVKNIFEACFCDKHVFFCTSLYASCASMPKKIGVLVQENGAVVF